ncbi:MAG: serine protease [Planctomycetota bacterium]|mgnify:CR=1 FL=1
MTLRMNRSNGLARTSAFRIDLFPFHSGGRGVTAWVGCLAFLVGVAASAKAQSMKPDTLDRVKKSAVLVFTAQSEREKGDRPLGSGSGFFINGTGLLISNNHVVDPVHGKSPQEKQEFHYKGGKLAWSVIVDSGTGDEKKYDATVIYQNETADQAVLQAFESEGKKLKTPNYLRFLPESRLQPNIKAWALGFPGGDSQRSNASDEKHPPVTVSEGNTLEIPRSPGGRVRLIFTDVNANRGNSGGPMVDIDGFLIGTVTLKAKPEDREDTGGANYSALVPAKLTREMIQNALAVKKIPDGTDYTPFIEILTNADGRIDVPEFRRQKERDALFFPNGDRIFGASSAEKIKWESPIGVFDIPVQSVAYVMKSEDGSHLFMEGGNRLAAAQAGQKFRFKPEGGTDAEYDFDGLNAVGFKTAGRKIEPVSGKVVVFDSDLSHLVLSEVTGSAKFQGTSGAISVAFEDISRLETTADGENQVLLLTDERRITGHFDESTFSAKIAATGTPVSFGLKNVKQATVEVLRLTGDSMAGLSLIGVMAKADQDVARIARRIELGDVKAARARIGELLAPEEFKKYPTPKKEELTLLDGVLLLREGQYEQATKALRKSSKASNENAAAYSEACLAVMKKFPDGKYNGKPLSDASVFVAAGAELAKGMVREVRGTLLDLRNAPGDKRADYLKGLNSVKKYEDSIQVASVLGGAEADDEMLRLWRHAFDSSLKESERIEKEIEEKRNQGGSRGGSRGGSSGNRLRSERELDTLQQDREKARETARAYFIKLQEYGFRIEDPDIQKMREEAVQRKGGRDKNDD